MLLNISLIGKNNVTSQISWVFRRGNFSFDVAHVFIVSLWLLRPLSGQFWDTAMMLLLKYTEWNGDFTSIDKSILSNFELWRCSSQWVIYFNLKSIKLAATY